MARAKALRIPDAVAERLLAVQPRVREISPQAREWGLFKRLLRFREAVVERPVPLARELAFWEIEDDDALEDFLSDKLLAALPRSTRWEDLPAGYAPLLRVLEFERHQQFEGWTAVTNHGSEGMPAIVAAYRTLGLGAEADALAAAAQAAGEDEDWEQLTGDEEPDPREEAIARAYARHHDEACDYAARISAVLAYVRGNPGLFGVAR